MTLVKKFLKKNNKIVRRNNTFVSNEIFDNEIVINFSSVPTNLQINKSILKYNKDFAYSFTHDDGYSVAYSIVFPKLQGVASGSTFFSGLTYTDGCGNDLYFRVGLSIPSLNTSGSDIHINTPSILTWPQITELLDFDWDIYNHGYHSSITGGTYTDYYNEVKNNEDYIFSKTGYRPRHFVIPNGVADYIEPAWDFGVLSQSANRYIFPISGVSHEVSRTGVTVNDAMSLYQYCMYKDYMYVASGVSTADTTVVNKLDLVASKSTGDTKLWWYQFAHGIESVTGSSEGNLNLATFNYLWEHVYNTYGKNGNDKVWVAPFQEVYDYLKVRDNTNITYTINGNSVTIKLNQLTSFSDLRRFQLSLNVSNDTANIESIVLDGYTNYSYNGTGTTNSLINLDWSYGVITLAEKYVTIAENNKLQVDIDKAQYFVNKINIATVKSQYETRVNNIVVPTTKIYLIDFGQGGFFETSTVTDTGSTLYGLQWNNITGSTSLTGPSFTSTIGIHSSPALLKDTTGVYSSYGFQSVIHFNKIWTDGVSSDGIYPSNTLRDGLVTTGTTESVFKFTGLNVNKIYDFSFCPSRSNSSLIYNSIYSVTGNTNYGSVSLQGSLNSTLDATISSIVPNSSGEIYVGMRTDQTRAYLNALKIIEN